MLGKEAKDKTPIKGRGEVVDNHHSMKRYRGFKAGRSSKRGRIKSTRIAQKNLRLPQSLGREWGTGKKGHCEGRVSEGGWGCGGGCWRAAKGGVLGGLGGGGGGGGEGA